MASTETSPLLPRGMPPTSNKTVSWRKESPASPTVHRRGAGRTGSPQKAPTKLPHRGSDRSDDDSDDRSQDGDEEEEEEEEDKAFADDPATRAAYGGAAIHSRHLHGRRAQQAVSSPTPLSYASDSSAGLTLARHKSKWPGSRAKVATLATTMEKASSNVLVPRRKARRSRFRSSSDADQRRAVQPLLRDNDRPPAANDQTVMARVAAYCTSDQIGVFKLLKWLERCVKDDAKGGGSRGNPTSAGVGGTAAAGGRLQLRGWKTKMYMGVVHAYYQPRKQSNDQDDEEEEVDNGDGLDVARHLRRKDAFYFATGCCVFWGLTREEEATHIQALAAFSTGRVAEIEAEDMEFTYGDGSRIANDAIFLSSVNVEEKLAISFAMSQSAKLDVFEERVEDRIRNTKHIPFNLATTGSIQYSQTDISKLIGQLFIELADVNLHSDILDEPDFLWEDDEYEPLYRKMVKYLDVNNRVKILNKRLDILRELVDVLNQELTQQHGTKLEWIIIWLLVAEIVISLGWNILVKDLLGFFNRK